jgi:hypothetical protein
MVWAKGSEEETNYNNPVTPENPYGFRGDGTPAGASFGGSPTGSGVDGTFSRPSATISVDKEAYGPSPAERMRYAADKMAADNLKGQRWGRENEGMFNQALASQEQAAMGNTPSVANLTTRNAQNAALGAMQSGAGQSRGGGSLMLGQMGSAGAVAGQNAQAGLKGAAARSGEIQDARMGLFGGISDDRRADIAGNKAKNQALQGAWGNLGGTERFNTTSQIRGLMNEASQYDQDEARRMGILRGKRMQDATYKMAQDNATLSYLQGGAAAGGQIGQGMYNAYSDEKDEEQ